MNVTNIVARVKRGVRVLDRKVPNWRTVLRKHQKQYDFRSGEHCVLGTLEHHAGRMRVLKKRLDADTLPGYTFGDAEATLGVSSTDCGFDAVEFKALPRLTDAEIAVHKAAEQQEYDILDALWRAEFTK